jgi:hypothetical protein
MHAIHFCSAEVRGRSATLAKGLKETSNQRKIRDFKKNSRVNFKFEMNCSFVLDFLQYDC